MMMADRMAIRSVSDLAFAFSTLWNVESTVWQLAHAIGNLLRTILPARPGPT